MFFPLFMPKSESLPSLFRPSLPLLFTKEQPWTICSFSWAHKKEWFAQKNWWPNSQPWYHNHFLNVLCSISNVYIFILINLKLNTHVLWPSARGVEPADLYQGFNEWLWAIRSDRSGPMSNCERFAQISQDRWVTVNESLRSLMTKEQPWGNRSGCSG